MSWALFVVCLGSYFLYVLEVLLHICCMSWKLFFCMSWRSFVLIVCLGGYLLNILEEICCMSWRLFVVCLGGYLLYVLAFFCFSLGGCLLYVLEVFCGTCMFWRLLVVCLEGCLWYVLDDIWHTFGCFSLNPLSLGHFPPRVGDWCMRGGGVRYVVTPMLQGTR